MNDENLETLNDFGKLLVTKVRDDIYENFLKTIDGKFRSPADKKLTNDLKAFSPEQLEFIKKIVLSTLDSSLHYFLWMIEQSDDFDLVALKDSKSLSLREISGISGTLYGELYGENGWVEKYSKYYSEPEVITENLEPRGPLWEYLRHNFSEFLREHNLYDAFEELGEKEAIRISEMHPEVLFINRCPKCNFIKKTPKAKLCLGCGDFEQNETE